MNKFEQLIEYVINDEQDKAKELFHEIVVEKSRNIYEELMAEEEIEEAKEEDQEELDEAKHEEDEELDESLGGDQADDLIDDVEADEEGMNFEADETVDHEEVVDGDAAEEGAEDLEDRVVDLEDKLDELMAEFEALMGDEGHADEEGAEELGAEEEMDSEAEADMDVEDETMEGLEEGLELKAAPKPVTSEEGSVNTKGVVAANSGAAGMAAKPVATATGEEKGRPAPAAKDLGVASTQDAGKGAFKSAAPKAQTKEPAGVNTKSIN